jgi:FdrA protein
VGLFCGGTLCTEAQLALTRHGRRVVSNAPAPGSHAIDTGISGSDRMIDLGADEYTRGRPHPMLDPSARDEMVREVLSEPGVAVILLDVVIGNGAHADPAGHVAAVLTEAKNRHIAVVASVTGTEGDPQIRSRQIASLRNAGVQVAPSNALAAGLALRLLGA